MVSSYIEGDLTLNPKIKDINKIQKCWEKNCVTIGFGLTGGKNEWSEYVINQIAKEHNLVIGKDIKIYSENGYKEFTDYIQKHMNQTRFGIVMCTKNFPLPENDYLKEIPCGPVGQYTNYLYSLIYNFTESPINVFDRSAPDPLDANVAAMKLAIDKATLEFQGKISKTQVPKLEMMLQGYPKTKNRLMAGYDSVSMTGPMFFFIPPLLIFGMIASEIVKEKELKLRHGLSVMGVSSTAFWFSWFITGLIISFLSTNCLIISGYLFKFDFFLNCPYIIQFANFEMFGMTMLMLGFWLTTILNSAKLAYTISYTFLLFGIVLQSFLQSHLLTLLVHINELPNWAHWVRWGFTFYPGFNFSLIYYDIATKASSHPNYSERRWESGTEYIYENFWTSKSGYIKGFEFYIPPSIEVMQDQIFNFFIFITMAWLFDHILPNNRGKSDPVYFMFTRDFWGCKRRKKRLLQEIELAKISLNDSEITYDDNSQSTDGLRIEGLCKTYKKHWWSSSEDIQAVKPMHLEVQKEELLGLIGHNGAGKTTLLSMLTGLLSPSSGTAFISDYDINHDMDKICNIMGYCPQFNILWDELTGYEHLMLFSIIKNIPKERRVNTVVEKLKEVDIEDAGDLLVGKYSGGMKRRLSVAIAGIGNPSIIFMDEPTTGMDPISKRFVWKLIQKMKKDRVFILTTHSMEEAEVLADKIAVMVDGKIKCIGTPLYLKNHFGEGYKIELISKDAQKLWNYIEANFPTAHLVDMSGGSLVVSIPRTEAMDALRLYKLIESEDSHVANLIENWGLSNSSLEEVFMRVTEKIHHYK